MVVSKDLRRNMGAQSRKLVMDRLNWDVISRMYLRRYESAMESAGRYRAPDEEQKAQPARFEHAI